MEAPDAGFAVITLPDELDAHVAPRIRSGIRTALGGQAPLVVDLTQARELDAAVIAVLLDGLVDCERDERPLLLLLPDEAAPEVRSLFELTGLSALLPFVRTWDEAARRLAGYAPPSAPGWTSPVS